MDDFDYHVHIAEIGFALVEQFAKTVERPLIHIDCDIMWAERFRQDETRVITSANSIREVFA